MATYIDVLIAFAPDKNIAYVFDTTDGTYRKSISVNFVKDKTCSAIASKGNIAIVVSRKYVYVIRLDFLLSGDAVPVHVGKRAVLTRVHAPAVDQGKTLASAAIYGQHLYIAQVPKVRAKLVLHSTSFDELMTLNMGDYPDWSRYSLTVFGPDTSAVSLFTSKWANSATSST